MRVFLAGATGAIGRRLTPMLTQSGHEVIATTRTPSKARELEQAGVEPVVLDALNREAVFAALVAAKPEVVIHMLTALPQRLDPHHIQRDLAINDRLREDGTRDLVAAAQQAGAKQMIAQSAAFLYMPLAGVAGRPALRTEEDALDFEAPKSMLRSINALHMLEHTVRSADGLEGVVLRFGHLYGPATAFSTTGATVEQLRRRRLPLIGGGQAVWSFVHIDDAARAVLAALHAPRGVCNIVDDDPAPVSEWLPELARAVDAPPPRHRPARLARLLGGAYAVRMMTKGDGASNERAREILGWKPQVASWRQGFKTCLE
jgi:nucleoside-diphosphate-sugar epimerase